MEMCKFVKLYAYKTYVENTLKKSRCILVYTWHFLYEHNKNVMKQPRGCIWIYTYLEYIHESDQKIEI